MGNSQEFQFVGADTAVASEKISWPQLAQALCLKFRKIDKLSASQAFEAGVAEFNSRVDEDQMIPELPVSYTNKNAGSVMHGMAKRFLKRINTPSARGHAETVAAAQEVGLVEPKSS